MHFINEYVNTVNANKELEKAIEDFFHDLPLPEQEVSIIKDTFEQSREHLDALAGSEFIERGISVQYSPLPHRPTLLFYEEDGQLVMHELCFEDGNAVEWLSQKLSGKEADAILHLFNIANISDTSDPDWVLHGVNQRLVFGPTLGRVVILSNGLDTVATIRIIYDSDIDQIPSVERYSMRRSANCIDYLNTYTYQIHLEDDYYLGISLGQIRYGGTRALHFGVFRLIYAFGFGIGGFIALRRIRHAKKHDKTEKNQHKSED